jgi:hypothetical protein
MRAALVPLHLTTAAKWNSRLLTARLDNLEFHFGANTRYYGL